MKKMFNWMAETFAECRPADLGLYLVKKLKEDK